MNNASKNRIFSKKSVVLFLVFIIVFFSLSFSFMGKSKPQHKMFSDIESLNVLSKFISEEIEEDSFLKELDPMDSFCYKVKWNSKNYYVYAYIFETSSQCMQYVKNRRMPYNGNLSYHLSSNFIKSKYVVYSDNKVLYIDGPGVKSMYSFIDYIGQNFDIILNMPRNKM